MIPPTGSHRIEGNVKMPDKDAEKATMSSFDTLKDRLRLLGQAAFICGLGWFFSAGMMWLDRSSAAPKTAGTTKVAAPATSDSSEQPSHNVRETTAPNGAPVSALLKTPAH